MKKVVLLCAVIGLFGCAEAPATREPLVAEIPDDSWARAIEANDDFSRPILVEVWDRGGGPTVEHLTGSGYLARTEATLALTEKATTLGADETFFQSDVPVFRFPIGHLELLRIESVVDFSATGAVKQVDFFYRRSANELGRSLLQAGSGAPELARIKSPRDLPGRAIIASGSGGWRVVSLELPANWG